jgi:hypothetical protein
MTTYQRAHWDLGAARDFFQKSLKAAIAKQLARPLARRIR